MKEFSVGGNEAGQRLDRFLSKYLKESTSGFIYKMLRKKNIVLNGAKASGSEKLKAGDIIRFYLSDETFFKMRGEESHIRVDAAMLSEFRNSVFYEDENILLLNKPHGMLSQKSQNDDLSAAELMIAYCLDSGKISREGLESFSPAFCNRLDRNTTGIMAGGLNLRALQLLNNMFRDRSVKKYYLALVKGHVEGSSHLKGYLTKDEKLNIVSVSDEKCADSEFIETSYEVIRHCKDTTLLKVHLITGKSHQIRAHLSSIGHPVIGDMKYGDKTINDRFRKEYGIRYQMLHAYELIMPPISDEQFKYISEKEFTTPVPDEFIRVTGAF